MKTLAIDLETYSEFDIKKVGLYKYAANCEILLFAYAIDDNPVEIIDLADGEIIPENIVAAIFSSDVLKTAYNAPFEIQVLKNYFKREIDYSQWQCSMVMGLTLGLPAGLEKVGQALKLPESKLKLAIGKRLIKYFSTPNSDGRRNLPTQHFEKWFSFKEYCKQDVESERAIRKIFEKFPMSDTEKKLWLLDQKINDNGVLLDMEFVQKAIEIDEKIKSAAKLQAEKLTGGLNVNSNSQILDWIEEQEGWRPSNLDKETRAELLQENLTQQVRELLILKNLIGKTSVKKYEAMLNMVNSDNRARGMFQFYGANRTGRFTGKGIQLQNLPQNHIDDLDTARKFLKSGDLDALQIFYGNPSEILSQLIRTAFIAEEGKRFIVADFSAIEARIIAWLANEEWRIKVFENGGDIYCASASAMFKVPVEKHGVNKNLRAKGKIAELACIAEGELVLTNKGLIPIEKVTTDMKIWDGESWIYHDGVVFKGEKQVIEYEGLTATPDHLVWVERQSRPIQFGIAAASGAHLIQTGNGRAAIRLGENNQPGKTLEQKMESLLCANAVYKLRFNSVATFRKFNQRKIKRLSAMLTTASNSSLVRQTLNGGKTTLRKPQRSTIAQLRSAGNKILLFLSLRGGLMDYQKFRVTESCAGIRQNQQQWQLRGWQSSFCKSFEEQSQQARDGFNGVQSNLLALCVSCGDKQIITRKVTRGNNSRRTKSSSGEKKKLAWNCRTAKVYDIRNAGKYHRFTVSDKLVHNCGYGGGVNALKAFGADKMGLSDVEMDSIIKKWRESSPNICKLWREVENGVKTAIQEKIEVNYKKGISFKVDGNFLFITLPSKRKIAYAFPKIIFEEEFKRESVIYYGTVQATGAWGRNFTWGGKLVENIVQATARDCLAVAMLRLDVAGYKIVMHVHDEIICEMSDGQGSLNEVVSIMSKPIEWAKNLVLTADGYETKFYRKD